MPLFDYICQDCGHRFEALVRNREEKAECPQCKSTNTEGQLGAPSVTMGNPYLSHVRNI
jgi:putative FmdB family regulatory protein